MKMTPTIGRVAVLVLVAMACADNPGVKVRITNPGFDVAVEIAVSRLKEKAETQKIELVKKGVLLNEKSARVYNAEVTSLNSGPTSLRTVSGKRLRLQVTNGEATISAEAEVSWADTQTVQISLFNVDVTLDVDIEDANGTPQVAVTRCSVANIQVVVPGILRLYHPSLQSSLRDETCKHFRNFTEGQVTDEIQKITKRAKIGRIEVDYKFARKRSYGDNYMDVYLTGDIYWDGKKIVKQFTPAVFPKLKQASKVVSILVSEAVFHNLFHVAHEHQILQKSIETVGEPHVKILIITAAAPMSSFKTSGVSFQIKCNVTTDHSLPGQNFPLDMIMDLKFDAKLKLRENKLAIDTNHISSTFHHKTGLNLSPLENGLKRIGVGFIKDKISKFKLPLPDYLTLKDSAVTPMQGFIMIEADAEIHL